jgi:predicted metal-dependent hydrolase
MPPKEGNTRHRVAYGDEEIHFTLRYQPSRLVPRVAIHVEPDGSVLVDAPSAVSTAEVLAAVKKRSRWICQHVLAAKARLAHVLPREYVSGEALHYLGRRYRLKVIIDPTASAEVRMRGAFIVVVVPENEASSVRRALVSWYRKRAREVFAQRLQAIVEPLRWIRELPPVRLQFMRRQWGSCSPSGRITLNPWLVMAPREAVDYVLLHEVCHLKHHNHSRAFYSTLDRHMPGWRQIKERLDERVEEYLRQ